jgi:hypothetical protein
MHETYMRTTREDSRAAWMLGVGRHSNAHVEGSFAKSSKGFASVEERKIGECNVLPMSIYTMLLCLATHSVTTPRRRQHDTERRDAVTTRRLALRRTISGPITE